MFESQTQIQTSSLCKLVSLLQKSVGTGELDVEVGDLLVKRNGSVRVISQHRLELLWKTGNRETLDNRLDSEQTPL